MKKVALVTGAGSGIGRACALALLQAGWHVALAGRRADALESTRSAAGELARNAIAVPTDATDPAAVKALFAATRAAFGRLDLLFNNAGTGAPAVPLEDLTVEQWRSVVDVNLTAVFLCTQEAFRMMKSQSPRGGRIINNAITGLTKSTSLDGRAWDIACGQIDIGNAVTEMTERMTQGMPQANGELAVEARMDVRHVADAVVHMASLPLGANVQFMTVMATKMPFVGRG